MDEGTLPEPDNRSAAWQELRTALLDHWAVLLRGGLIEDFVQQALVGLWQAKGRGTPIGSDLAFCKTVVRRRIVDRVRRTKREVEGLDQDEFCSEDRALVDWIGHLRASGFELSDSARECLELIQSGTRSNKGMARALGRDVSTIKERRKRLQDQLRRFLVELNGVHPPPSRRLVSVNCQCSDSWSIQGAWGSLLAPRPFFDTEVSCSFC